ncbi:hypothetical protein LSTR_LSTR017338 [Laodelphax striatellus]|uniref:Uncharacterized protein n=1 Tax=Laodelphax striatellus TaxID=195883 RepID=A0A482XR59_LAOST|nr:hypothetical protein LSTR_LSTR017338 [Laodelphax striatellus]
MPDYSTCVRSLSNCTLVLSTPDLPSSENASTVARLSSSPPPSTLRIEYSTSALLPRSLSVARTVVTV